VGLALSVAQCGHAQLARKTKEAKGPRALGLVELSADGSARLIPISIMVDGKFYDAGAYKASPVPLALWSETVYEAEKTGVSQGLFTVGEAMRTGANNWFAEGKWRAAGSEPKPRRKATKPKVDEDDEGPPKLRRAEPDKPETAGTQSPPVSTPAPADDKKSSPSGSGSAPGPAAAPAPTEPADQKPIDVEGTTDANDEDPNRPVLKRGKTETLAKAHPQVGASTGVPRRPAGAAARMETKAAPQAIPAISDAGGPEPRPYLYEIKPDEEQKYRKGMLALAADAMLARVKETAPVVPGTKPVSRASARTIKATQPTFDDVQFRAFDLWNTNEPVFVLSATAHLRKAASTDAADDQPYYVTLVAKKNIYDELRKLYAGVTDPKHLDESPRLELIDAVDADGDGRGELLFRRVFDVGSAWAVYRAGADQLFPLFEGTPGQ
jgi:hypothetical protein